MGGGDARVQLNLREGDTCRLVTAPMIVGVEFDQRRPAGDLVADRADHLLDSRDFLSTLRDGKAGLEALRPVGATGDDGLGRDQHAGPRDDPLIDCLLEPDVGEARAFGSEVALGREARLQGPFGMHDGAGGADRQRLVKHLIVPKRLVVRVQEEV
jgi:hypothetical protein